MNLRYTAFLLLLFFCCCHKSSDKKIPVAAFTFSTSYDSVINTYANTSFAYSISINVLTGSITGNSVSYTLTNLPTGVTDSPLTMITSVQLGGIFHIKVGNVATGAYQLDLESNCTATGKSHHSVILNVLPLPDYSNTLAGTYPGSNNYCTPSNQFYLYSPVITAVSGTPFTIKISNVRVFDTTLTITALLSTSVVIPFQTIGSYSIRGTGNFTHDKAPNASLYMLTLYDSTVHGHDSEACLMHIQH